VCRSHNCLGCSEVLATASSYFRRRLEDWDSDPWSMMGADGQLVLVVGMEEDELKVAESVVKLMYESAVPYSRPAMELAQVGTPAQMSQHKCCCVPCVFALCVISILQRASMGSTCAEPHCTYQRRAWCLCESRRSAEWRTCGACRGACNSA
jgi:hypothetical protein